MLRVGDADGRTGKRRRTHGHSPHVLTVGADKRRLSRTSWGRRRKRRLGSARVGGGMGIVNRRNAVAGWAAWKLAKRMLRKKAEKARPQLETAARRPKAIVAFFVAAAAGVVTFLRSRGGRAE